MFETICKIILIIFVFGGLITNLFRAASARPDHGPTIAAYAIISALITGTLFWGAGVFSF